MTQADLEQRRRVALIGSEAKAKLFSGMYPIGQTIRLDGISYEVIGVLRAKMQEGDDNVNRVVDVPLSTMSDLTDTKYLGGIWFSYQGNYAEVEHALGEHIGLPEVEVGLLLVVFVELQVQRAGQVPVRPLVHVVEREEVHRELLERLHALATLLVILEGVTVFNASRLRGEAASLRVRPLRLPMRRKRLRRWCLGRILGLRLGLFLLLRLR